MHLLPDFQLKFLCPIKILYIAAALEIILCNKNPYYIDKDKLPKLVTLILNYSIQNLHLLFLLLSGSYFLLIIFCESFMITSSTCPKMV